MKNLFLLIFCISFASLFAQSVDKSGVKTNTISLPTGPGSIEGLGESFQPSLNTGQANYGVSFALPAGTAGHAPSLGLSYNGGSGNGAIGTGWNMNLPFVQRQCDKGIPLYVDDSNGLDDDYDGQIDEVDELDVFINEMKEELVLTEAGYYFCENEGAFVRYKKVEDHWEAHLPNGTLLEFGLTTNARIIDESTNNTYSWLLERMTDVNGNTITYRYTSFNCKKDLNQKYLSQVAYGAGAPPWEAFHFVQLEYEDRFDWFEDARAGFSLRTGMRLSKVYIGTQGVELEGHLAGDFNQDGIKDHLNRLYQLDYDTHPHWSLLSKVTWIGGDGNTPYPPITFRYSNSSPRDTIIA
ncbi:MAG: SpvB/TcaC N-terminal domain-containing protein, partial [Bacteroidota bacterium]